MTDPKSERVLWFQGGMFFFLGCLASGILLLLAGHLFAALPLAIAVWAFCRVYYFASHLIEKYLHPIGRSTGLTAPARSVIVGPDAHRLPAHDSANSALGLPIARHPMRGFLWLVFKWFLWALVVSVCAPSLYKALKLDWRMRELVAPAWIAWQCVLAAACVSLGVLLNVPWRYRLCAGAVALFALTIGLDNGIDIAYQNSGQLWIPLMFAFLTYVLGTTLLWWYRHKSGWSLGVVTSETELLGEECSDDRSVIGDSAEDRQVTVRDLLVTMTIIGLLAAFLRIILPERRYWPPNL